MTTRDIDPGCGVLDLLSNCDEGRQIEAINEEFAEARRRVLSQPGGSDRITLTIKLTAEVQNADEMLVKVGFEIKRPTRSQAVAEKVFLDTDTEIGTDHRGMPTQEIVGTTMHIRNPRQQVISYSSPTIVPEKGSN